MHIDEFLGIQSTHNPHRWVLPITPGISTLGNFMFGGCGLATAVTVLEQTCDRPLIWATAQYLSYGKTGSILDLDVRAPVAGKNVTQARAVGHVGDREVLTVNAALGRREIGVSGNYASCPDVPPPEECEPDAWRSRLPDTMSIEKRADIRLAMGRVKGGWVGDQRPKPGRSALWVRMKEGLELSSATLAIIADWVPSGLSQSVRGGRVGGNSLDNTIRIYDLYPTEWILCDIRIHGIQNGFGHGTAHLWTEDGRLMATASQSLIVREWTKEQMDQLEKTMKPRS